MSKRFCTCSNRRGPLRSSGLTAHSQNPPVSALRTRSLLNSMSPRDPTQPSFSAVPLNLVNSKPGSYMCKRTCQRNCFPCLAKAFPAGKPPVPKLSLRHRTASRKNKNSAPAFSRTTPPESPGPGSPGSIVQRLVFRILQRDFHSCLGVLHSWGAVSRHWFLNVQESLLPGEFRKTPNTSFLSLMPGADLTASKGRPGGSVPSSQDEALRGSRYRPPWSWYHVLGTGRAPQTHRHLPK